VEDRIGIAVQALKLRFKNLFKLFRFLFRSCGNPVIAPFHVPFQNSFKGSSFTATPLDPRAIVVG